MALVDLPSELILLTASFLDNAKDKVAFEETCRRVYEVTKGDLFRFLAVREHANTAIRAALAGDTVILDLLWPYNPRFVNRYWEHRLDAPVDWEGCHCGPLDCEHPSRRGNSTLDQRLLTSVFDRLELGRVTACFQRPEGSYALLHFAALYNDTELISWLLDHGADIDQLCKPTSCLEHEAGVAAPCFTALQLALCNRSEEAAELLIERGASLDGQVHRSPGARRWQRPQIDLYTPAICIAAAFGLSRTVQLLLRRGIDIHTPDHWGYTAVHHAADRCWEEKYLDIFALLAAEGADLRDRANSGPRSPLEIAFRQGNFAVVLQLVRLGVGYDEIETGPDNHGSGLELLHFACAFDSKGRGLRYSLHSCFSISRLDDVNFLAKDWETARQQVVEELLDLGKDPNLRATLDHPWCRDDTDGYTPPRGQMDQAYWETRAHSGILPRTNVTALNAVSFYCSTDLVALLIRRGAEVDAQDTNRMTLLWLLCPNELVLDEVYPAWELHHIQPGPVHEWQMKMELLLRSGARIDPWADSADGVLSESALNLVSLITPDVFSLLMEKTTALNMSTENLELLAAGLLAIKHYDKALNIYMCHGPFHLEAREIEAWEEGDPDTALDALDPRMGDNVLKYVGELLGMYDLRPTRDLAAREQIREQTQPYLRQRRQARRKDRSVV
ncbi:ankyrin [Coniochaeta ligniaria NRRL 30616]|uniref:Ankyrin n=1 Tax=Coniochaeta ligniaria NRRL 30616 TaxID=1408157 RepID=A0A1J7I815_9PEZI|nr:ankyrin [Coniochaeta ligniaria NRRL 30616]